MNKPLAASTLSSTTVTRMVSVMLLLGAAGFYLYTNNQQQYYSGHALPAAKQILSDISRWEKSTLVEHLSDEARQAINDQQLEQLLEHYRQFGKLESLGTLNFSHLSSALSLFGSKRIHYSGSAQFDSGSAQINITLLDEPTASSATRFKIYNLSITR